VIDGDLGVDEYLRVISYTRNLIKEDEYTLTLAEFKRKKFVDGLTKIIFDGYRKLEANHVVASPASLLANTLSTSELKDKIFEGSLIRIDKIGNFSIPAVKFELAKEAVTKGDFVVSAGNNGLAIEKRRELVVSNRPEILIEKYAQTIFISDIDITQSSVIRIAPDILMDGGNMKISYVNEMNISKDITLPNNVIFEGDIGEINVPFGKTLLLDVTVSDTYSGLITARPSIIPLPTQSSILLNLPLTEHFRDVSGNDVPVGLGGDGNIRIQAAPPDYDENAAYFEGNESFIDISSFYLFDYIEWEISFRILPQYPQGNIFSIVTTDGFDGMRFYLDSYGTGSDNPSMELYNAGRITFSERFYLDRFNELSFRYKQDTGMFKYSINGLEQDYELNGFSVNSDAIRIGKGISMENFQGFLNNFIIKGRKRDS
jgi:hypothetical protein